MEVKINILPLTIGKMPRSPITIRFLNQDNIPKKKIFCANSLQFTGNFGTVSKGIMMELVNLNLGI
jgi:hypothetical protein